MSLGEIINVVIAVVGFIVIGIIKKTPEHILDKNLEKFKGDIQKDLQELRIATENIHPMKIEEYIHFTEVYTKMMDAAKIKNLNKQKAVQKEIVEGLTRFGFSAFLFGSDQTVKKFVEIRKYATLPSDELGENERAKTLILMSELMIHMRNDLGSKQSEVTIDDLMIIIVKDWGVSRDAFLKKASKARMI